MMGTIFKAAMNHIRAEEDLKRKTKDFLIANLSTAPAETQNPPGRFVRHRAAVAVCTVVLVCAISAAAAIYYHTPSSYISLDINPSVELGVNGFGKVVSATAYDSGGATLLNGQDIMDADVKSAVHTLVRAAAQKGFVAQDGSTVISVTSETDNTKAAIELENSAAQGAEAAIKSEGKTARISKDHISMEKRDEAKRLAITPGKLRLIQELQELDPSVTVSEYKDAQIKDIIKRIDELKESANPDGDDTKDISVPSDNDAPDETAGKDTPESSGTASGTKPQETGSEDSPVSSDESGKGNHSDSSGTPGKENSSTASSKKGTTSSQAQSSSGSTSSTKAGSRSPSSLSSQQNR